MLIFKNGILIHETEIRVTYKDTDKMGYSYYGNYPTYFEIARTEFLRDMGLSYKKLEDDGFLLPIYTLNIKYHKPAKYDDLLKIQTFYKKFHSIKVEFDYKVYNQKNELLTDGNTLLVFIDAKTRKPIKAPDYYIKKLSKFLKK